MNVSSYIFQSPYSNQVQIGRPDPNAPKEDNSIQTASKAPAATNKTVQEAQAFQTSQVNDVKPTVESAQLLDVYA